MIKLAALVWLTVTCVALRAEANFPDFSAPVVDAANILSAADKAAMTRKVQDLQDKTGVQFAVATVSSLGGEEIEPYANALFRRWKLGEKGVNNGLLLLLAPKERKLRFEVGYGLEGSFTDLQSKLILRNTMVPKLKAGDPAGALEAGVDDAITVLTKNKADLPERLRPDRAQSDQTSDSMLGLIIFFAIFVFVFLIIVQSLRRGRRASWGPAAAGGFIGSTSDFGSSSFGDSSSGGDSFSGGGGGDSGGGGSSDSY